MRLLLVKLYKERLDVLKDPTPGNKNNRDEAWLKIATEINARFPGSVVDTKGLSVKWNDMVYKAKKEVCKAQKENR